MKKNGGMLLFLLVMTVWGFGQSTPLEKNDSVCALVKRYINEKAVDSLYALTGETFRKQIKPDVFKTISNNNIFPLGELKTTSFVKSSGKISYYKAVFSSATLSLIIGLDSLDKLEAFAFLPYSDEGARKTGAGCLLIANTTHRRSGHFQAKPAEM